MVTPRVSLFNKLPSIGNGLSTMRLWKSQLSGKVPGDSSGGRGGGRSGLITLGIVVAGLASAAVVVACGDDDGGNGGNGNVNNSNSNSNDGGVGDAGDGYVDGDAGLPECPTQYTRGALESEGIFDSETPLMADNDACEPVDMVKFRDKFYMVCTDNRLLTWDVGAGQIFHFGSLPPDSSGPEGTPGTVIPQSLAMATTEDGIDIAVTTVQTENSANDVKGMLYFNEVTETFNPQGGGRMDAWDLAVRVTGGQPIPSAIGIDPLGAALLPAVGSEDGQRLWVAIQRSKKADVSTVSDTGQAIGLRIARNGDNIQIDREQTPKVTWWNVDKKRPFAVTHLGDGMIAVPFAGAAGVTPKLDFYDTADGANDQTPVRSIELNLGSNVELIPLPRIGLTADRRNFVMAAVNTVTGSQEIIIQHINNPNDIYTTSFPAVQRLDISTYVTGPVTNVVVHSMSDGTERVYVTDRGDTSNSDPRQWTRSKLIIFDIDPNTATPSNIIAVKEVGRDVGYGAILDTSDENNPRLYLPGLPGNCDAIDGTYQYGDAHHGIRIDLGQVRTE